MGIVVKPGFSGFASRRRPIFPHASDPSQETILEESSQPLGRESGFLRNLVLPSSFNPFFDYSTIVNIVFHTPHPPFSLIFSFFRFFLRVLGLRTLLLPLEAIPSSKSFQKLL